MNERESVDPTEISFVSTSTDSAVGISEPEAPDHVYDTSDLLATEGESSKNLNYDVGLEDEESCENISAKDVTEAKKLLKGLTASPTLVTLEGNYDFDGFKRLFPGDKIRACHRRLIDGVVQIFEIPSQVHEAVAANVFAQLTQHNNCIESNGSADIVINNQTLLQPDGSLFVLPPPTLNMGIPGSVDHAGKRQAKIVLEVSVTEPYRSIAELPRKYFAGGGDEAINGIQGVIIFIIRRSTSPAREGQYQMIALYYPRNNVNNNDPVPSIAISFGHYLSPLTKRCLTKHLRMPVNVLQGVGVGNAVACNQQGLPTYQFPIPNAALCHGFDENARLAMALNSNSTAVDLFNIQRRIVLAT